MNTQNTYFRDEASDELHTTINGVDAWHSSELTIDDVAAANGLTRDDFNWIG